MKKYLIAIICSLFITGLSAQDQKEMISRACYDYIEGFYEGDTTKLIRSLDPALYKFGYWKDSTSGKYGPDGNMTFRQALDYAKNVQEKKRFAKSDAPKKVEILDVQNSIAAVKVTAWWGIDYILLGKQDDKWMIREVLWEGPLNP
jgi:Putative lumazine-binding